MEEKATSCQLEERDRTYQGSLKSALSGCDDHFEAGTPSPQNRSENDFV